MIMNDLNVQIRKMNNDEHAFQREMFYEALYAPEGEEPYPKDIIEMPELCKYFEDWNRTGDYCLIAEKVGEKIGAVWCRVYTAENKGYGYVNDQIPELTIAVKKEYRNLGIGKKPLDGLIIALKETDYSALSLSVDARNPAVNFYKRSGFIILKEIDKSYTMIKRF